MSDNTSSPATADEMAPAATEPQAASHADPAASASTDDQGGAQAAGKQPAQGAMSPARCAEELKARFPALFGAGAKPLKLKIQVDIQARAPGVFSKQALSAFFRRHTGSTSYLVAVSRASHRVDLDGQPAGELSDEHRQAAVAELARRRELSNTRREQDEQARRHRAALWRDFQQTTLTRPNFCALKGIAPEALDDLLAQAEQEAKEAREAAHQRPAGNQHPRGPRPPEGGRRPGGAQARPQHRAPRPPRGPATA